MKIFGMQGCFVPQKSMFDLNGQKSPVRRVTVNLCLINLPLNGFETGSLFNFILIQIMDVIFIIFIAMKLKNSYI